MSTETQDQAEQAQDTRTAVDRLRDEQLEAGQAHGAARRAALKRKNWTAAEHRAGHAGATPFGGRVDNMTRRSDADVLTNAFCVIDYGDPEHGETARTAVEAIVGAGNAGAGRADYGVFVQAGTVGDDGYPETAVVLLRDEHSCQVVVPYACLRPSNAGGRR